MKARALLLLAVFIGTVAHGEALIHDQLLRERGWADFEKRNLALAILKNDLAISVPMANAMAGQIMAGDLAAIRFFMETNRAAALMKSLELKELHHLMHVKYGFPHLHRR